MGSPAVVSITETRAVGPAGPRPAWAASVAPIAARAAAAHCTASSSHAVLVYRGAGRIHYLTADNGTPTTAVRPVERQAHLGACRVSGHSRGGDLPPQSRPYPGR